MTRTTLAPAAFWQAVEIYLREAYDGANIPKQVRDRLGELRTTAEDSLYEHGAFERDRTQPDGRIAIRLGNRVYPHMKLVVDTSPNGPWPLLCADTHDGHIAPAAGSPACEAFNRLMCLNAGIASRIETAWADAGLPTFKKLLKDDLARRLGHG